METLVFIPVNQRIPAAQKKEYQRHLFEKNETRKIRKNWCSRISQEFLEKISRISWEKSWRNSKVFLETKSFILFLKIL